MRTVRARGRRGSLRVPGAGAIAGLVAVTPAAGNSGPFGAIILGAIAGTACCWFVLKIKPKLGFYDSLDVFGIHGIGGLLGPWLTPDTLTPALARPARPGVALRSHPVVTAKSLQLGRGPCRERVGPSGRVR